MPFRRKSYDSLPALSVRGPALRASLRWVTAGWMVGVFWGAFMMGRANVQLRLGDREGASRYVSAFNFYTGVGGMLGGLAGAGLTGALSFLRDDPIRLGPIVWNNWHATFVLSMGVRIAGGFVLGGGRDQKAD